MEYIKDKGYESITLFSNPSYASAFLGISNDDRAVYDYDKMVEFLQENCNMGIDEAMDFIDFNDSFRVENNPIILYKADKL